MKDSHTHTSANKHTLFWLCFHCKTLGWQLHIPLAPQTLTEQNTAKLNVLLQAIKISWVAEKKKIKYYKKDLFPKMMIPHRKLSMSISDSGDCFCKKTEEIGRKKLNVAETSHLHNEKKNKNIFAHHAMVGKPPLLFAAETV